MRIIFSLFWILRTLDTRGNLGVLTPPARIASLFRLCSTGMNPIVFFALERSGAREGHLFDQVPWEGREHIPAIYGGLGGGWKGQSALEG